MNYIEIPLTQGMVTRISPEDLPLVERYTWAAVKTSEGKYYARAWDSETKTKKYLHRLINNTPEGMHTDHIDGDSLNNTRSNLRTCTQRENILNRPKLNLHNSISQYKGVTKDKRTKSGRWVARLAWSVAKAEGISQHLGTYDTEEEAARAYDAVIKVLYGEFARLNFPDEYIGGFAV